MVAIIIRFQGQTLLVNKHRRLLIPHKQTIMYKQNPPLFELIDPI